MARAELIHRGKVRDVYSDHESLYLVATDRISAFDVILPTLIPEKGKALTQLSRYWFEHLPEGTGHHIIGFDNPFPAEFPDWTGRVTHCHRLEPLKVECVARGYLAGSAWVEYREKGTVQGIQLPTGLKEAERLDSPIFTPTTKADAGHDQPLTEAEARSLLGDGRFETLRDLTLRLYRWAHEHASTRGILIADTKLEFGLSPSGAAENRNSEDPELVLIDEIFTSDSSRFWPADEYEPGRGQFSFDKQYVRDYLLSLKDWNRQPPGPELPDEIVEQTRARYFEVYERITGKKLNH
jgi:phosphoribosylaminoimidazole-succinocarboxamide synthase